MTSVVERFLKYVKFDTESDEHSTTTPSTMKQKELGKVLVEELKALNVDAFMDEFGIVYGKLASNIDKVVPQLGFLAHMDTSPDMCGKDVKARIINNYDGKDIVLNEELDIVMQTSEFEALPKLKGKDIIVTDGTTLLGADDKAGIAQIMAMIEELQTKQLPHGELRFAFTCDEEVGRGTDCFNIPLFDADYAFTVDGGEVGSVDYENFNAASAKLVFHGTSIHPGEAKDKMINALHLAMQFHQNLPKAKDPALTSGYEGFHHLCELNGGCEQAQATYIIRDHDRQKFEEGKKDFIRISEFMNKQYQHEVVSVEINDSYYNMEEVIRNNMYGVELAKQALEEIGIKPYSSPIRGGTDGARLTFDGLMCPNLGTGGYHFHGKYELACIQEMEQGVACLLKMIELSIK